MDIFIRQAMITDMPGIRDFTDFWLSGRGLRVNAPGAVNDCFISPSQHQKYITKYKSFIVLLNREIIGWAVTQNDNSLIHFLISGEHRRRRIGTMLLEHITPPTIRSKSDQSSGDPGPFYEKLGYHKIRCEKSRSRLDINKIRPHRKKNIDIYTKTDKEISNVFC